MLDARDGEAGGIDAVLLDAAGTLIRPMQPVGETYAALAKPFGARLEPETVARAFADVFSGMPDLAFSYASMEELRRLERDWWHALVAGVITRIGQPIVEFDAYFDALYGHYAQRGAWCCYGEVLGVLDGLCSRGYRLAVVSNFDSRLPGILESLGIQDRLDLVIYSSAAGSAKPNRRIFAQALEGLGVSADRALHVGDSIEADYEGAIGAGLDCLLLERGGETAAGPDASIQSLEELIVRVDERKACSPISRQ